MKKHKLLFGILFACALVLAGCSREPKLLKDAKELVSVLEAVHPAFPLHDIPDNYESAKQEFLNSVTEDTTKEEFVLLARKFLAVLQDGHTGVTSSAPLRFLYIRCYALGDELFLLNDDGSLSQDRITHIGGVPVNRIFETVQAYFPAENEAARNVNNRTWAINEEMLKLSGCKLNSTFAEVTVDSGGNVSNRRVNFFTYDGSAYTGTISNDIRSERIGDIFYIDMDVCEVNENLETQANELKKAIEDGITKVIIDVRDNSGGDSGACVKLLEAMDMTPPQYGAFVRYSKLAKSQREGYTKTSGFDKGEPDKAAAKRNDNIRLVVLTNENTFSSATMMAVFVKDGGLGTVIGTPSSNAPSSYGDILYYDLPASGVTVSISHKRFLRPDPDAEPSILLPDIVTEFGQDALSAAIEFLNSN